MALAVVFVKYALPQGVPPLVRLAVEIITGVGSYTGTLRIRHRERISTLIRMAKSLRH
jgi:hypothetical protein